MELRGVSLGYDREAVLSDVDLVLRRGERVAVLGPNGAGKTTLLRGILGLVRARRGEVRCAARRFGLVPQRDRLDPLFPITARELVLQGAAGRVRGWHRSLGEADRSRAESLLDELGLRSHADRLLAHLSGGQRQRALVARAMLTDPEVLLLDEPTSGVDAESTRVVLGQVERAARQAGVASLMVTHDLGALRGQVDHVWRVERGGVTIEPGSSILPALDGGAP